VRASNNKNLEPLYSELLKHDNSAFPHLVDKFIADLPDFLAEIEQAMLKADNAELKSVFHKIKGVSGNYGYPQLYDECKKAEKLCQKDPVHLDVIVKNNYWNCKQDNVGKK